jgi:hypothetical protein
MRIAIAILIACSVALALIQPARAEGIKYVEITTDTKRLEQLTEDSKYICWHALSGPDSQIQSRLESESRKRDYNSRDLIILEFLCQAYLEGVGDGAKAADVIRVNRT